LKVNGDMALVSKLNGVSHQVEKYLLDPLLVAKDLLGNPLIYVKVELKPLLLDRKLHDVVDLLESLSNVKDVLEDLKLVVLEPVDIKEVFHNVVQVK
jgi:hypothetical protein